MSRALVLAKKETQYGTDATPTAANNALLVTAPTIEVIGKSIQREVLLAHFGTLGRVNVGEGLKLNFGVEVAGMGTATTPPRYGCLFQAGAFTEAIDADSVDYTPNSNKDTDSVTLYFFLDDKKHVILGAVTESIKLSAKAGEFAKIDFSLTGLYAGNFASDLSIPSPTYAQQAPPRFLSAGVTIGAYSPLISSFELEIANKLSKSVSANAAAPILRYRVAGRDVKGSMDPEAVTLATWNPWSLWENSTSQAIAATIGASAGNKLVLSLPNAAPSDAPKYGDREGLSTYTFGFAPGVTVAAGNNEVTFSFA